MKLTVITLPQIKDYLSRHGALKIWNSRWYGWHHWIAVVNMSKELYKSKGGNYSVIINSSYLYTVGRKRDGMDKNSAIRSSEVAREILVLNRVHTDIDIVCEIIKDCKIGLIDGIRTPGKEALLEFKVVSDAVRLATFAALSGDYNYVVKGLFFKDIGKQAWKSAKDRCLKAKQL